MTQFRERVGLTLVIAYMSTVVSQLANQGFFFLLLRYLSVDDVGLYSWAVAIATIFAYVLDLGLSIFLVGELSAKRYSLSAVLKLVFWLRVPVVVLGILILQGWLALKPLSREEYWVLCAIGLTYVIQLVDGGLIPWFQVRQKQNLVNTIAMFVPLSRLAAVGSVLLFGAILKMHIVVVVTLGTQLLATSLLLVRAIWEVRGEREAFVSTTSDSGELLKEFCRRGPRLALMYSLNIFQARFDWLLVSALVSRVALANYSVANKVVEVTMLLSSVWARTSFPWWSRLDANEPEFRAIMGVLRRLFVVSCGVLGVVVFFAAPWLVHFAFGTKYDLGDSSLRLMSAGTVIFMLNQYLFYVILSKKLEQKYITLIVTSTILQILMNLVLLPRIGIVGAASGMLVMGCVMHGGQLFLLKRVGFLSAGEVLRTEIFVAGAVSGIALSWSLYGGGLLAWGCAMVWVVCFSQVLIGVQDRVLVGNWLVKKRRALLQRFQRS